MRGRQEVNSYLVSSSSSLDARIPLDTSLSPLFFSRLRPRERVRRADGPKKLHAREHLALTMLLLAIGGAGRGRERAREERRTGRSDTCSAKVYARIDSRLPFACACVCACVHAYLTNVDARARADIVYRHRYREWRREGNAERETWGEG